MGVGFIFTPFVYQHAAGKEDRYQWTGTRFQERERQIQLARERNETHIGGEIAELQESRREQKRVRKQATGIVNLRA